MTNQNTGRGKRITPDKADAIITNRLAGQTVRATAATVGVAVDTVIDYWNAYLDETAADRADHLERARTNAYHRLWQAANHARRAADESDNPEKCLAVEVRALTQISKILGMEQVHITHSVAGTFQLPDNDEAAARLAKLPPAS